jgi:type IV secretory pathway protease TraF
MAPTLLPGDRLLALRTARVRPGDIVTAVDPRAGERLLLKRVLGVEETSGSVNLQGDNPASSTDSRHFGPVDAESIRSRIVYRYAPDSRAGRLGRRGVTTSRRTRW